jgi:hypothetical protein
VSKEDAIKMCDVDNEYCSQWDEENKIKSFFTKKEDYLKDE